jgi:CRISPR-associated protein Csb2
MPTLLDISVRFLLDEFDGRGDGGAPEWPPSPLRLFQTLTNSAARLGMESFAPSLEHLESLRPPVVVASKPATMQPRYGYKTFVPNNLGDLVAKSWIAGRDNDIANYRVAKEVYPTHLPENATIHYLWEINEALPPEFVDRIRELARAISAFGWGINMVVADACVIDKAKWSNPLADSEEWFPSAHGSTQLRIPIKGTLAALESRHRAFLGRLPTAPDGSQFFHPVPPLETFRVATYGRGAEIARPPHAVFSLREMDDSRFAIFDPQWRRLHLVGMLRHSASRPDLAASLGWDADRVNSFVLGHDKSDQNNPKPTADAPRLVFVPLPSIEWRGEDRGHAVGPIRRVLVTVNGHCDYEEFRRIVRALEGRELIDEKQKRPVAFLRRQSERDQAITDYITAESSVWTTVTPVVLPGHDDPRKLRRHLSDSTATLSAEAKERIIRKLDSRIERLLRKALLDSGMPPALVANAEMEWRGTGFLPGVDFASRYSVPDHCRRFRRIHVRVMWRERALNGQLLPRMIAGPLCAGVGRFSGLGLFVPCPETAS